MPAIRNVKRFPYSPQAMLVSSSGGRVGDRVGDGLLQSRRTGHYDLSHVPDTVLHSGPNQSFVPPASASGPVPTSVPAISFTADAAIALATTDDTSGMRAQTAAPVGTPRTCIRARSAAKSPYDRVNSTTTKPNADLDEIIKNCPAVDVLLGGYATSRSSTHSRGRDQEHVSRPPNAFMVYRSYVWFTKQLDNNDEKNLSCVSKLAAESWKEMSDQARAPFHGIAAEAKRRHAELYPDYKYAPASRADKPTKPTKRNAQPASKAREKAKAVAASTKERPVLSSVSKGVTKTGAGSSKPLPIRAGPALPGPASTNKPIVLSPTPKRVTWIDARTSSSPPIRAAPTSPVATCTDEDLVLSPILVRGMWTAAWTTRALFYGEPPESPEPSWSTSSSSSTALSTPELRPVPTGELGYIWDCDLPGYPPKPRFGALRIPSPAVSELELEPSLLAEWPDKYAEAESYHNLQPSALLFCEDKDGLDPNTQVIPPPTREDIDYSRFISGNPDAKLLSPTLTISYTDTPTFAPPTKTIHGDFDSSPSTIFDGSMLNMLTLGRDLIVVQTGMCYLNDIESLDPVVASGIY